MADAQDKYVLVGQSYYLKNAKRDENGQPHYLPAYIDLKQISIEHLKGLDNCTITFNNRLTAIMGVNGVGKSTIIQALACCYQPDHRKPDQAKKKKKKKRDRNQRTSSVERFQFKFFFRTTSDNDWKGSRFTLKHNIYSLKGEILKEAASREYYKGTDRWAPRYTNQPFKNVVYFGIDTCIPDIESYKNLSRISYTTQEISEGNNVHEQVLHDAASILNKPYEKLTENVTTNRTFIGVQTRNGLSYSSLSMGAGEQRVINILERLSRVEKHSLILIDEIELLLHPDALCRLIRRINEIAEDRQLQVIFTSHSLLMQQVSDIVSIKYLLDANGKTQVLENLTSTALDDLSGNSSRPITIWVEDKLSEFIIKQIARDIGIQQKVQTFLFGAANNAFGIAASLVLMKKDDPNTLIVLDGDVCKSEEQKLSQIKKCFSGTEKDKDKQYEKALSFMSQYNLSEEGQPEKFLHGLLLNSEDQSNPIVQEALKIHSVLNNHEWIDKIAERIDNRSDAIYTEIIRVCSKTAGWKEFVRPIEEWMEQREDV